MRISIFGMRRNGTEGSPVLRGVSLTILSLLVAGTFAYSCRSGNVKSTGTEGGRYVQLKSGEIEKHAGTKFPLTGRHRELTCGSCHKTSDRHQEYSCHDCHKGHSGDHDGRCLDCHTGGFPGSH